VSGFFAVSPWQDPKGEALSVWADEEKG
jgi:hypothetical protein